MARGLSTVGARLQRDRVHARPTLVPARIGPRTAILATLLSVAIVLLAVAGGTRVGRDSNEAGAARAPAQAGGAIATSAGRPAPPAFSTGSVDTTGVAPPAAVAPVVLTQISALASDGIPAVALLAYRNAATAVNRASVTCHLPWSLLAGIGRVESDRGAPPPPRRHLDHEDHRDCAQWCRNVVDSRHRSRTARRRRYLRPGCRTDAVHPVHVGDLRRGRRRRRRQESLRHPGRHAGCGALPVRRRRRPGEYGRSGSRSSRVQPFGPLRVPSACPVGDVRLRKGWDRPGYGAAHSENATDHRTGRSGPTAQPGTSASHDCAGLSADPQLALAGDGDEQAGEQTDVDGRPNRLRNRSNEHVIAGLVDLGHPDRRLVYRRPVYRCRERNRVNDVVVHGRRNVRRPQFGR
jgi:hypothetical protein